MEVKAEVKVECLEGTTEATSLLKDRKETMLLTHGTGRTSILTHWADTETECTKEKRFSFELNRKLPTETTSVRKTKSLSSQFIVNVEELMNNVTGSYDIETAGTILSRASSNEMGSFVLSGSPLLSENISDVKLIHQNDSKKGRCEPVDEDPDVCSWRKMHLEPTLPIYLKFEDVRYSVTKNSEKQSDHGEKCILQGVTGSVGPGEVLALMGPSGGGKTTLLNLLSGRVKSSGGSVTYNDQPFNKSLKQRIGYVLQDDITFPHLTVRETLTYSALLRLPNTLTADQKKERVANIIGDLDLERCQDTLIGGALVRGISGGERKRVCIGSEVLLNPSLLFLDEPTSGLDSTTALKIVQMLHNLAEAGKTVVATIHQPSSRLFANFDKLILLGKGSFLYSGKASEAMPYFSSIGCSPFIAMNPAEFLIDIANGNMKDKSIPSELEDKFLSGSQALESRRPLASDVHEYLIEAYESRVASFKPTKLAKPLLIEGHSEIQGGSYSRDVGATWLEQFSILFRRGLKERRHEYLSSIRIVQVVSTAIIVGLLWWHSDASSPKRVHEQAGLLFFISVFWAFFPLFTAIFTFPQERAMLAKERSVGMYKLSAYVVARNSSDIPLDLILPVVFLGIVYFMVGLKPSFQAFSFTLLTIFLSVVASQGLGQTIGAAFMDVRKATTLASITVMTFMLSGGFFIQNVPSFMSWVRYISLNYHTYRLLLRIQYSCSDSGPESGICMYPFIKRQGLDQGGAELGATLMMIVGYRVLAYLFLRRMKLRAIT